MNISFCIPTRNRSDTISATIDSIISQNIKDIEIVIVDGASTDGTEKIINNYKESFPNIIYYKRNECVGVDRDILKTVSLSSGDYCWLMSDDDILTKGALKNIIEHLNNNPSISGLTTNYIQYNHLLKYPVNTVPASHGNRLKENTYFDSAEDCFSAIGLHLGFLSCQIINRAVWRKIVNTYNVKKFQNNWMMVYIIGKMMQEYPSWHYFHNKSIIQRIGNDSFVRGDIYKRELITHQYYSDIIEDLFGRKSQVYNKIFYYINIDRLPRTFANLKAQKISIHLQLRLLILYTRKYYKYFPFWLNVLPLFFLPNFIFAATKKIYFKIKANQ